MRTPILVAAAAFSLLGQAATPQKKPDFSGRWVITDPAKDAGKERIVTQDAKTLTVEQPSATDPVKMTYQLDGIERRMAIPARLASDVTVMAAAAWDGNTIVISTNISYSTGMKTQARAVWSIDTQGRLVIDISERGPDGPGPSGKLIHVKKK